MCLDLYPQSAFAENVTCLPQELVNSLLYLFLYSLLHIPFSQIHINWSFLGKFKLPFDRTLEIITISTIEF